MSVHVCDLPRPHRGLSHDCACGRRWLAMPFYRPNGAAVPCWVRR